MVYNEGMRMGAGGKPMPIKKEVLQEIVEPVAEFTTVKKQKLKKARVLEERLLDELPSDDAGEENETI
jgi:hypothetical protein